MFKPLYMSFMSRNLLKTQWQIFQWGKLAELMELCRAPPLH